MTWAELARIIEAVDGLDFDDGDAAAEIKAMIVHALRFADFHDISLPSKEEAR